MTSTGTKVIAFELGLIIAILTWIAHDGLPWARPQAAATPQIAEEAVGMVAPVYQPVLRRGAPVDYPADDLAGDQGQEQGNVDAGPDYDSGYDEGVTSARYVQPDGILFQPGGAPDSIGIYPEPVLWSDCYYPSSYGPGYGQFIVVSNARAPGRRHQAMRRNVNPRRMNAGRLQNRRPQARMAPRRQNGRVFPGTNSLSFGQMTRQRPANFSRPGRVTPGRAAPAQRSRGTQGRR